jgi:CrcB protein
MDWMSNLVVGVGGALGAIARFSVGGWIVRQLGSQFPWGTFAVNVAGSFCVGLAMALLTERFQPHPYWRLFLVVGFLGGFTTFSSFEYETLQAVSTGGRLTGVSYMLGSVVVGYAAVWLGTILASRQ